MRLVDACLCQNCHSMWPHAACHAPAPPVVRRLFSSSPVKWTLTPFRDSKDAHHIFLFFSPPSSFLLPPSPSLPHSLFVVVSNRLMAVSAANVAATSFQLFPLCHLCETFVIWLELRFLRNFTYLINGIHTSIILLELANTKAYILKLSRSILNYERQSAWHILLNFKNFLELEKFHQTSK